MTYLQSLQLTNREPRLSDVLYRIRKLSERYAQTSNAAERAALRTLGARLIAERDALRK